MFSLPYLLPMWRSRFLSMIPWTQKRFLMGGHVTLDWQCEFCKLLATPTCVSFSFFFFSWKYRLTKKASSGTPAPPPQSDRQRRSGGFL